MPGLDFPDFEKLVLLASRHPGPRGEFAATYPDLPEPLPIFGLQMLLDLPERNSRFFVANRHSQQKSEYGNTTKLVSRLTGLEN